MLENKKMFRAKTLRVAPALGRKSIRARAPLKNKDALLKSYRAALENMLKTATKLTCENKKRR